MAFSKDFLDEIVKIGIEGDYEISYSDLVEYPEIQDASEKDMEQLYNCLADNKIIVTSNSISDYDFENEDEYFDDYEDLEDNMVADVVEKVSLKSIKVLSSALRTISLILTASSPSLP